MKAEVVHKYGGPDVLKTESIPDPSPGAGEVLIRVVASSVNPVDWKRRSGEAKDHFPINFPDVIGVDVSGTIEKLGTGVKDFEIGDRVFAMAQKTYAEFCVVKASDVAHLPDEVDLVEAARIPLVTTTGYQVTKATNLPKGATVVIPGATGSVGRSAVFTAKEMGLKVIVAVKSEHMKDANDLGADQVISTDEASLRALPQVDGVVDLVGGPTAETLIARIKDGGVLTSVLMPPKNAAQFPKVKSMRVQAQANPKDLIYMTKGLIDGKFKLPIEKTFKMSEAGAAQAAAEKGGVGKILLVN